MADETDVANLSEDEFDKQFEELMNTPTESEEEEVVDTAEPEEEEVEEDEEEETVEQDQESDDEDEDTNPEEAEAEEDVTEDEETEETGNSTQPETVEKYNFGDLPMDEVLPFEVKASGSKMKVTLQELVKGFEKGIDYTQKLQGVAGLRKTGALMEDNGLSDEDLNLLIEAKGGNKQALAKLISDAGVDSLDIDTEEGKNFVPQNHAKEMPSFEMESIQEEIRNDVEVLPAVKSALQTMPQGFYDEIDGNAGNLKALYTDVKSGAYDEIMPEMKKLITLEGAKASIGTYKQAAEIVASRRQPAEVKIPKVEANPQIEADRNEKRNSAVSGTKRKAPPKNTKVNFEDLDDSDFEAEFKKMTGRAISDYS